MKNDIPLTSNIYKFSSHLIENTLRLHYEDQPVKAVFGNNGFYTIL
jgi:hypothetical protein